MREETVEQAALEKLSQIQLSEEEKAYLSQRISNLKENWGKEQGYQTNALNLRLSQIQDRFDRLTDAYIDRLIEKGIFEQRNTALLMERKELEEALVNLKENGKSIPDRIAEMVELAGSAYLSYKMGFPEEKRDLLKTITSNREVDGKNVDLRLAIPFNEIANRFQNSDSAPSRDIGRTLDALLPKLTLHIKANEAQRDPDQPASSADKLAA